LRAFAAAFRYNPAISLRIGGEGPLRHDLEQLATQLGIAKQVTFLGKLNREQVLNEMLNCDAFVLSSNYETFGVVLIEATACGKPVIAISGSGPDCIVKPLNGVLVPPQDITALSTALQLMQSQIGQFDSNLIREDCLLRFGARSLTEQLITIYKKALEDNQETK
jgi:glycosyltransferase involved in cell wall biosynthesis